MNTTVSLPVHDETQEPKQPSDMQLTRSYLGISH